MSHTNPTIVTTNDLSKRAYITFYYNGNRVREYNANSLQQRINPNRAKTIDERSKLLEKLQFEYRKALEAGNYPQQTTSENKPTAPQINLASNEVKPILTTEALLLEALNDKLQSNLSRTYKRDLQNVHDKFIAYLSDEEKTRPVNDIQSIRIQKFLMQFGSSGTYYMNKRRTLGVLFKAACSLDNQQLKTVQDTPKRKVKARLHEKYDKEQLRPILDFIKSQSFNLYICCLLTYSSWLRPHEEIRLLTPGDFTEDLSEIRLSGSDNKGGQIRVVHVPDYARDEIRTMLLGLNRTDNLFSRVSMPYNYSYFNTQWSRAHFKMQELKLIRDNQTIYSFRHTAAVLTYKRTKDVHLLQKLLGHSNIVVTLKYLRSLGELNSEDLKNAAPTLD